MHAALFGVDPQHIGDELWALSANAILVLNKGAMMGGFAHDTGEGSISPYHREFGGDLIWEIGSGYFGCRASDGSFDPDRFSEQAADRQVEMIEIKLSQDAKPGHGGILPAEKISAEISATRGVPMGQDCLSPARHSAFSTPLELMAFIDQLRRLSGGQAGRHSIMRRPAVGVHGHGQAMRDTGTYLDFIVVDGAEGGTGALPLEFSDHLGLPMRESLLFVHDTLVDARIRDKVKVGAAGKIISGFDIAAVLALGADWTKSAEAGVSMPLVSAVKSSSQSRANASVNCLRHHTTSSRQTLS